MTDTATTIERGERWAVARSYDDLGDGMFRRVRQPLGITAFGMNVKVMEPGSSSRSHWHTEQQEVIFVHRGAIEVQFGDSTVSDLGAGAIVLVDANEPHQVRVTSDESAVLVMLGGRDGVVEGDAVFPDV